MLRATVLGSGSGGNALAVCCGADTLLLDCGFSAREAERRLRTAGIDPASVRAVLLSHEHSDHLRGVRVFATRWRVPVYASRGTTAASGLDAQVPDARTVEPGGRLAFGTLAVTAFRTSHDAVEPLGFRFDACCGSSLGVLTDSGRVTGDARETLHGCTVLAIETNHDEEMLERGPYPWFLKRRIRSAEGHLSNAEAARLVAEVASDRLERVVGLHLSATNNAAPLAAASLAEALRRLCHHASVGTATQESPCLLMA
ncbi:MAG TPA: MBL fold metallo-hydrolase [Coriobacteriia bacterium]|nr:MBL fold metallo-hydrolase [Coriobacteriia bacterium]